jgi:hypothetical protein
MIIAGDFELHPIFPSVLPIRTVGLKLFLAAIVLLSFADERAFVLLSK